MPAGQAGRAVVTRRACGLVAPAQVDQRRELRQAKRAGSCIFSAKLYYQLSADEKDLARWAPGCKKLLQLRPN